MPEADDLHETVRRWVVKAENDLHAVVRILTPELDAPTDTICFHAQQCIDKYLKAPARLAGYWLPENT
jgi:HEPN domain-containing protein